MNLKKIIPIITAVLAFCVVAVIVVLNTTNAPSDTPSGLVQNQGDTFESTASTDPVDIQLAEFKAMVSTANEMLASGEVITLNKHNQHEYYLRHLTPIVEAISFDWDNNTVAIDTSKIDAAYLEKLESKPEYPRDPRYLILLSWIIDKYPDCVVMVGEKWVWTDENYRADLYLCIEYKDAGYETAEDFYNALKTGAYKNPVSVFKFSLVTAKIELIGGKGDNLYKMLIGK